MVNLGNGELELVEFLPTKNNKSNISKSIPTVTQ